MRIQRKYPSPLVCLMSHMTHAQSKHNMQNTSLASKNPMEQRVNFHPISSLAWDLREGRSSIPHQVSRSTYPRTYPAFAYMTKGDDPLGSTWGEGKKGTYITHVPIRLLDRMVWGKLSDLNRYLMNRVTISLRVYVLVLLSQ